MKKEELDAGLKAYLEVEDSYSRVPYVYVFADISGAEDEVARWADRIEVSYLERDAGLVERKTLKEQ